MSQPPNRHIEREFIEAPAHPPAPERKRLKWETPALIAGLVLILGSIGFAILSRPASEGGPVDTPQVRFLDGNVFHEGLVGEIETPNPLLAQSAAERDVARLIYSGLTRLDAYGDPVPDLAESWQVNANATEYIFTLRQDVFWHDGERFTSEDVAFTMSLLRDSDFPAPAALHAFWRGVETYPDGDYRVRFVLTQPLWTFPEYAGVGILPAHWLAGVAPAAIPDDPFHQFPVGTGPLRWVSLEDDVLWLVPYERFYDGARNAQIAGVALHLYPDSNAAFRALGSDLHAVGGLTSEQLAAASANGDINLYAARLPQYAALVFNHAAVERLPFFQDEEVRQALTMSLDREALVQKHLGAEAVLAISPVLPGNWAYSPDVMPLPYDTAQAAQLFEAAGWLSSGGVRSRDEVSLNFTLLASQESPYRDLAEDIAVQWRAAGADVRVETLSPEALAARLNSRDESGARSFDVALLEFNQGGYADPDPYVFWHPSQIENGQNLSGLADYDISEALEVARRDPNGVRRTEQLWNFQRWFVERAEAILLYNPVYHYAVSCQVENLQLSIRASAADRFDGLSAWRIARPDEFERVCGG